MIRWRLPALVIVFAAGTLVSAAQLEQRPQRRFPALNELWMNEGYMGDLGLLMMGSHRFAADIAYIQFLQYYGTRRGADEHDGHDHADDHDDINHPGHFPELKDKGLRILRLDPYFNTGISEVAASLAFMQNEYGPALDFLAEAIQRDPSYFRYHLYASAILYRQSGEDDKLIEILKQAFEYPDCPPVFKSVLGNLLKKVGRYPEAADVYLRTYLTVREPSDRETALRRLKELLAEHPEAARGLDLRLLQ